MSGRIAFNHVGQCVADLERTKRFYVEVFDFTLVREISPSDKLSAPLLGLDPPLGMTASYLSRDGLVLELIHFAAPEHRVAFQPRSIDEPGLTHLSLSVEDLDGVLSRIADYGGEVLTATNIGLGVFVRDPDGQLVELLPIAYRDRLDGGGSSS